ncbi:MAG: tripartite tricarboxylate transporter substrate-binding protein [Pseudomonadota bacterium]
MNSMKTLALTVSIGILAASAFAQSTSDTPSESQLSIDDAIEVALAAQPGTVVEAERDTFEGRPVIDIEILNDAGEEIEFKVDIETGEILNVWTDDDPTDDPAEGETSADEVLDEATFLIPGHQGVGWDGTTRSIGLAFEASGVIEDVLFENRDGNNGGEGLSYMLDSAASQQDTLMLKTTQIVIRSLNGTYSDSFEDLIPVAAPIGDYVAFIVHAESRYRSMNDLIAEMQTGETDFSIGGGSAEGGIDHIAAVMATKAAGVSPAFDYVQFYAPAPALAALSSGKVDAIATDYSRANALAQKGSVRIIGVTAGEATDQITGIPTLQEQDIDMELTTWSGIVTAPGTSPDQIARYQATFDKLYETEAREKAAIENGWIEQKLDGEAFADLLTKQTAEIRKALKSLQVN